MGAQARSRVGWGGEEIGTHKWGFYVVLSMALSDLLETLLVSSILICPTNVSKRHLVAMQPDSKRVAG